MNQKEEFDSYMKIADWTIARCDNRRQFEWKLIFAIWTLLVAAIAYVEAGAFSVIAAIVILAVFVFWAQGHRARNAQDTQIAWRALATANAVLQPPILIPEFSRPRLEQHFGFLGHWSHGIQIISTVALLVSFCALKVDWRVCEFFKFSHS